MEASDEMKDGSKGSNGNVRKDEEGDETTMPEKKKIKKKDMLKDQNFISAAFLLFAEAAPNWVLWLLMTYFTQVWKESLTLSAAMVNLLEGCTAALSVLASFFAEAFPGQYLTALFSSITYATGLVLLWSTTTSKAPKRRDALHKLFYFALGLVALGKAGASATFHPFATNQRTDEDEDHKTNSSTCWSWRTVAVATVSLGLFVTGVFVLPFLKSWKVLFGVPALTMIYASFILLAFGYVFVKEKPSESALASVPKVLLAATFNMFRPSPPGNGSFLDKAISSSEQQQAQNQWLVCREEEVKDTRALLRMVPIWTTFFAHGLVKSIGSTYFLEQANGMNRHVGKLNVPLPIFLLFFVGSVQIADYIYKALRSDDPKDPDPAKKLKRQHIPTTAIWIGAFFSVLCCVTAAAVEIRRRGAAAKHPDLAEGEALPMSIFWLAPQYALLGYAHAFSRRGIRGFFADQVPAAMAMGSYPATFVESSNGVGTILSVVVVHVIKRVTRRGGGGGWFGETIDESRLDYFYWTLAVVSAVNLVFYTVVSYFYRYNVDGGGEGEEDLETPVA